MKKTKTVLVHNAPGEFRSPFKLAPWKPEPTTVISEAQYDLHLSGYAWISTSNGVHLRILGGNGKVIADVWPTTGKYSIRKPDGSTSKFVYNGKVFDLIERLSK